MQKASLRLEIDAVAKRIVKEPENIHELYKKLQTLLRKLSTNPVCTGANPERRHRAWSDFLVGRQTGLAPQAFHAQRPATADQRMKGPAM